MHQRSRHCSALASWVRWLLEHCLQEATQSAAERTKDATQSAAKRTKEALSGAAQRTKETSVATKEKIQETTQAARQRTSQTAGQTQVGPLLDVGLEV